MQTKILKKLVVRRIIKLNVDSYLLCKYASELYFYYLIQLNSIQCLSFSHQNEKNFGVKSHIFSQFIRLQLANFQVSADVSNSVLLKKKKKIEKHHQVSRQAYVELFCFRSILGGMNLQ
ncbi:hypothetical protein BpHYR1_039156 [Brachionus plicatilis]|uniref:Uncharacterized protein n=1 Tax=Brachionus plicatilis TaxID=10195 RepID=A0A3M7QZJ3_BRAPC|nr:hypothetical protein BpHYR1_039156 [Brachionus plicatilis]